MATYQDVMLAIRNGADAASVAAMIDDPKAMLTEAQMEDLRDEQVRSMLEAAGQAGDLLEAAICYRALGREEDAAEVPLDADDRAALAAKWPTQESARRLILGYSWANR